MTTNLTLIHMTYKDLVIFTTKEQAFGYLDAFIAYNKYTYVDKDSNLEDVCLLQDDLSTEGRCFEVTINNEIELIVLWFNCIKHQNVTNDILDTIGKCIAK